MSSPALAVPAGSESTDLFPGSILGAGFSEGTLLKLGNAFELGTHNRSRRLGLGQASPT
jgi:hypothetical protein